MKARHILVAGLRGGLGNQLFQYAAAWAFAKASGREVVLNTAVFGHYRLRGYLLDRLRIRARVASEAELEGWGLEGGLLGRLRRRLFGTRIEKISEQGFAWQNVELPQGEDLLLEGYWQSERYFKACAPELRAQFTPLAAAQARWLKKIKASGAKAVAVHVRRGDYVSDRRASAAHGALDLSYYRAAHKQMSSKVKGAGYFVFSDEPEWARANMGFLKGASFISGNPPEEDMRLMSACRHFVIANSSFSWWGAWLGEKSTSVVLSPARWFNDSSRDAKDLLPERWGKIG